MCYNYKTEVILMVGIGTLINTGCVILGGILGMFFGRFLPERFQKIIKDAVGLSVLFIGAGGALAGMLRQTETGFTTEGTYMIIGSLCIGALIGELINLDKYTEKFGDFLKRKFRSEKDPLFTEGFVNTTLTICIGAMGIVGSITDGLTGDFSILLTKGILDLIIVFVFAATYGKGCVFSCIPIFVIQGAITFAAKLVSLLFSDAAINNISLVGSMLIFCIGVNYMFDKKIKVANMVPSLLVAVIWALVAG